MKTVLFANQKGGSGKTTSAVAFAYALGQRGHRVLLVDLDPQGHATTCSGLIPPAYAGTDAPTIATVLRDGIDVTGAIRRGPYGYDVLASDEDLLPVEMGRAGDLASVNEAFITMLSTFDALRFDYVLIDAQAHLGMLTKIAMFRSDLVIVPVEAHPLAILGLYQFTDNIEEAHRRRRQNPRLTLPARLSAILLTKWAANETICKQVLGNLEAGKLSEYLLQDRISRSTEVAKSSSASWVEGGGNYAGIQVPLGKPIQLYNPSCPAAKDYHFAVEAFLKKDQPA